MRPSDALALAVVAAIAIIGCVVIIVTGHAVPVQLWTLIGVALGGGSGVAVGANRLGQPDIHVTLHDPDKAVSE